MDATFGELRSKEVINILDGARLGHISDLVLDDKYGKICGLIVPGSTSFLGIFKTKANSIYIPYNQICKIGEDVILVELYISSTKVRTLNNSNVYSQETKTQEKPQNKQ